MKRIPEIVAMTKSLYPNDDFFANFEEKCRAMPEVLKDFRAYDRALSTLDDESWAILKNKALQHYLDHRNGRRKTGFFHQLNEAFAYRHLCKKGFHNIRFLKEGKRKMPDIKYTDGGVQKYCEVKSIDISDKEIKRRNSTTSYDGSVYFDLGGGFANKLCKAVSEAKQQILSLGTQGMVYVVVDLDDFTLRHYKSYRKELIGILRDPDMGGVFIKIGLRGNRWVFIGNIPIVNEVG
jgi:hypothetical protein